MGFAQSETGLDSDAGVETLRVLLIDDDPEDRLILKDLIETKSNIICDVAASFDEGHAAVGRGDHDAYLVDLRLGAESGLDLIRQLVREATGPMVLLTGVDGGEADLRALEAGAAEYLVKDGLSPELVQRCIRYAIEGWRTRQRAEEGFAKYRSLFDGVPVGLFRMRPDRTFIEVNATAVRLLGYDDQSQIVGRVLEDLLADDQPLDAPVLTGAIEGELHLKTRDGESRWVNVTLEEVRDSGGSVTHYEGAAVDITDRKEAERELNRYRMMTTAAYDDSSVGKAVISVPEGAIVSANAALLAFLGYEWDGLQDVYFDDITHPDDLDADSFQFKRLMDGEIDSYTIDKRYLRSDSSVAWGRLQMSVIHAGRDTRYVLGEVVDITKAKEAEDRIAFQASLFQQMRTPVIATDRQGRITHWNRQAEVAYGWTAEEVMGEDFTALMLSALGRSQLEAMQGDLRDRGLWEGEISITRKDGTIFPAWASGVVLTDARGRGAGVVGAVVDLSDVQKARAEAVTQEMLNRSLLEAVSIPIAIFDSSGEVVASNPSWSDGVGDQVHPYLPCTSQDTPDPRAIEEIERGVNEVLDDAAGTFSLEYTRDTVDGERWMRVIAAPVENGGAVVSHWDITDERFARAALEETIRAKDEFITSVSHELRTPLSVVVGLAETLRSGRYSQTESTEFHDLIADQAQEMAMIVEDLLVAGRIDSDALSIREGVVDLEEEIEAVVRSLGDKEVDITVRVIPGADKLYADSLRVRQILRNLVTNAVRYGDPPVRIKAVRARNQVIVAVSDHGEGVPESALEKMFQPFSRFGAVEGQPSSVGLGLHVARRLARLMGGDLVYKDDAALTTFLLTLPAEPPDESRSGEAMRFVRV